MATYGPRATSAPAGAIVLHVGDNVSAIVNAAAAGTTFYFTPGVYRGVSLTPKDNQTFLGAEGAVLNGSALLTSFTHVGNAWVVGGQTQEGARNALQWADAVRGGYPETVFVNDKPLQPVDALSKVAPGTFYFDYAADKIYIGDNPAGKTVEAGKLDRAFGGGAQNVTIQNLVIEKYDPPIQSAAVHSQKNWTITNNEVRLNYGIGIISCDNSKIVGNFVHDNGEMGLGGNGKNILVEGNEISRNGSWSGINVFWEGGGFKFVVTDHLTVRGNYAHDNKGFGMWTDINNIHTLYENNVVVRNSGGGIDHEISYDAVIRNNTLVGNGFNAQSDTWMWGGQIQIQNSSNVDVYGNKLDMTGASGGNGITLIQETRGTGAYGPYVAAHNHIHDNTIVSRDGNGKVGGAAWPVELTALLSGANTWTNNHYFMANGDRFWWGNADNFTEFKVATGENGTLSQTYPDTAGWLGGTSGGGSGGGSGGSTVDSLAKATSGADVLKGTSKSDVMAGLGGNDQIFGFAGNDKIDGGTGSDAMSGGAGNDSYTVDNAGDVVNEIGGGGIDTVRASITFNLGNQLRVKGGVENLALVGSGNTNGFGTAAANTITGNGGKNTLSGDAGNDVLDGGAGNDTLAGDLGKDTLLGGLGSDTFDFNAVAETGMTTSTRDVIKDFNHTQHDHIDLSDIDAKAGPKNQSFIFIGDDAFTGLKGELHYTFVGTKTIVEGDLNGNRVANFQIELSGHIALTSTDFIL